MDPELEACFDKLEASFDALCRYLNSTAAGVTAPVMASSGTTELVTASAGQVDPQALLPTTEDSPVVTFSSPIDIMAVAPLKGAASTTPTLTTGRSLAVSPAVLNETIVVAHPSCSMVCSTQVINVLSLMTTCLDAVGLYDQVPTVQAIQSLTSSWHKEHMNFHTPWPPPYLHLAGEVLKVGIPSVVGVCKSNIDHEEGRFQQCWDRNYQELCEMLERKKVAESISSPLPPTAATTCSLGGCSSPTMFAANGVVSTELITDNDEHHTTLDNSSINGVPFSVAPDLSLTPDAHDDSAPVMLSTSSTIDVGVILPAAPDCIPWASIRPWLEPVPPYPPDLVSLFLGAWSGSPPENSIIIQSAVKTIQSCNSAEEVPAYVLSDEVLHHAEIRWPPWTPPWFMWIIPKGHIFSSRPLSSLECNHEGTPPATSLVQSWLDPPARPKPCAQSAGNNHMVSITLFAHPSGDPLCKLLSPYCQDFGDHYSLFWALDQEKHASVSANGHVQHVMLPSDRDDIYQLTQRGEYLSVWLQPKPPWLYVLLKADTGIEEKRVHRHVEEINYVQLMLFKLLLRRPYAELLIELCTYELHLTRRGTEAAELFSKDIIFQPDLVSSVNRLLLQRFRPLGSYPLLDDMKHDNSTTSSRPLILAFLEASSMIGFELWSQGGTMIMLISSSQFMSLLNGGEEGSNFNELSLALLSVWQHTKYTQWSWYPGSSIFALCSSEKRWTCPLNCYVHLQWLSLQLVGAFRIWWVAWTGNIFEFSMCHGKAPFQGGRNAIRTAFVNQTPAGYFYLGQAWYFDTSCSDIIYYHEDYHGDSSKTKELHIPWDPGKLVLCYHLKLRLGDKPNFKEGGMLGTYSYTTAQVSWAATWAWSSVDPREMHYIYLGPNTTEAIQWITARMAAALRSPPT